MAEKKILLDVSPTGVRHEVVFEDDAMYTVEHTPGHIENEILDSCARLRSLHQPKGRLMQHAARTPINTWQAWRKEWKEKYSDTMTWPQFEVMKLNSRDNSKLRTGNKRGGSKLL